MYCPLGNGCRNMTVTHVITKTTDGKKGAHKIHFLGETQIQVSK
jgi:hypothetical protein